MRGKLSYKLPLSLAAAAVVVGAVLSPVAGASGAPVATWTGAAGDNKFSTAKNWKEGKAPVNGAKLVFNCVANTSDSYESVTITNDSLAKIAEISTLPTKGADRCKVYTVKGDTYLQENAKFSGVVKGEYNGGSPIVEINAKGLRHLVAGNTGVVINNTQDVSLETYTATGYQMTDTFFKVKRATINSTDKGTIWLGSVSEAITLQRGAALNISDWRDKEHTTNVIFQGDGTVGDAYAKARRGAGGGIPESFTTTLSGNIVVNGTVSVKLPSWQTLKITGNLSGSGKFVVAPDNEGVFINEAKSNTTKTEAGVADSAVEKTITIEGNKKDEHVEVTRKQTAVLSGERQSANVHKGATLKGDGKVRDLQVAGVVSPSGATKRIATESFNIAGTGVYQAELLNKKDYSRVAAKSVLLDKGSTLQLTYLPDGKLKKGDVLTIIENTGTDAIQGTFKDLPEGAEVRVGNATFKISYKGGDGNDVTLTAQNDSVAPKAPNTGAASLVANPAAAVAAGAAAVIALFVASKRRVTGKR